MDFVQLRFGFHFVTDLQTTGQQANSVFPSTLCSFHRMLSSFDPTETHPDIPILALAKL